LAELAPSPGPLALLAGCLLPVTGAFAITQPRVGLLGLAAQVVAYGWLAGDLRRVVPRLGLSCFAAGGIGFTTWLYGGHSGADAAAAACRILYLVLPSALLAWRIRPSALGDALAQRLRLPARGVVAATAALQRLDSLGDQWQQISRARRARGLGPGGGPARRLRSASGSAFALLVAAMRQAGMLAIAMDVRGFAGARQRTWAERSPWTARDTVVVVLAGALAALPWLLR
jgi:energy-coupling factor transport system permease protein